MSFDWKEYIKLAENLIKQNNEACFRSGISRAYYGVFCIARNMAGYKNMKGAKVHKKVIDHYRDSSISWEQYVGNILDQLRKLRNEADYDEEKVITYDLAQRVLIKSKDILKKLKVKI